MAQTSPSPTPQTLASLGSPPAPSPPAPGQMLAPAAGEAPGLAGQACAIGGG